MDNSEEVVNMYYYTIISEFGLEIFYQNSYGETTSATAGTLSIWISDNKLTVH